MSLAASGKQVESGETESDSFKWGGKMNIRRLLRRRKERGRCLPQIERKERVIFLIS